MTELTNHDIAVICACCSRREVNGKRQIEHFTKAYRLAKNFSPSKEVGALPTEEQVKELILKLAITIEPKANKTYFRHPKGEELSAEHSFKHICWMFSVMFKPQEIYWEFKNSLPFCDGNGRLAELVWRVAVKLETNNWPYNLPPKEK